MAEKKLNRINLSEKDYEGAASTMCRGCGHDAITASIIRAFFQSGVDPRKVVKLSGIGCSSKTPAYFLSQAFGFNGVHGRMSALATGASLANRNLIPIGVSGDGDTVAIGLGNFCHMMRRNVNITYIVENNGVYGLTKGQFSATADKGSRMKAGKINDKEFFYSVIGGSLGNFVSGQQSDSTKMNLFDKYNKFIDFIKDVEIRKQINNISYLLNSFSYFL